MLCTTTQTTRWLEGSGATLCRCGRVINNQIYVVCAVRAVWVVLRLGAVAHHHYELTTATLLLLLLLLLAVWICPHPHHLPACSRLPSTCRRPSQFRVTSAFTHTPSTTDTTCAAAAPPRYQLYTIYVSTVLSMYLLFTSSPTSVSALHYLCIYCTIYVSIYLCIYLSVCLSVCMSVCLSVCLGPLNGCVCVCVCVCV